jgi:hypothetical protein
MKTKITFLALFLIFICLVFFAEAQLMPGVGPGNVKNIDAAIYKASCPLNLTNGISHVAITPGDGPRPMPPVPADDGLAFFQKLVAKQNEIIEVQKKRINQLEIELDACQKKLPK